MAAVAPTTTTTTTTVPRRTLFGFGRKNKTDPSTVVDNPVYAEFLKKKPPPPPPITRGDLADSSIFASEDAGAEAAAAKRLGGGGGGAGGGGGVGGGIGADGSSGGGIDGGRVQRDPTVMAAVLDPQPDARRRWERKMLIRDVRRRYDDPDDDAAYNSAVGGGSGVGGSGSGSSDAHHYRRCRAYAARRTEWLKRTERESVSASHFLPTSVKKLGALARQIAGKPLDGALLQMRFSPKRAAREVLAHLEHARNEAVVRRGMSLGGVQQAGVQGIQQAGGGVQQQQGKIEIELKKTGRRHVVADRTALYIDQAWVGRGPYTKEIEPRAMGRRNLLMRPSTSITVLLKEEATRIREHAEREQKRKNRKLWVALPNRPVTAQRPYYCW